MISAPNDVITKPATAGIEVVLPKIGDRRAQFVPLWLENLLLVILLGLFLFRGFVPAWRSLNTDFRNYYVAARLYREGESLLRVYDFTWFQRQKDHAGMEPCLVGFVPDTLISALPIVPLAELPPLTAKRAWLVINAIVLALSALGLMQITQLGWRRVLIVTFLAIEPLAKSFLFGQMHLLVGALLIAAVWLARRKWLFRCRNRRCAGGRPEDLSRRLPAFLSAQETVADCLPGPPWPARRGRTLNLPFRLGRSPRLP